MTVPLLSVVSALTFYLGFADGGGVPRTRFSATMRRLRRTRSSVRRLGVTRRFTSSYRQRPCNALHGDFGTSHQRSACDPGDQRTLSCEVLPDLRFVARDPPRRRRAWRIQCSARRDRRPADGSALASGLLLAGLLGGSGPDRGLRSRVSRVSRGRVCLEPRLIRAFEYGFGDGYPVDRLNDRSLEPVKWSNVVPTGACLPPSERLSIAASAASTRLPLWRLRSNTSSSAAQRRRIGGDDAGGLL